MKSIIKFIEHPDSELLYQSRLDEAVVTGETTPYVIYESEDTTPLVAMADEQRPTGSDSP